MRELLLKEVRERDVSIYMDRLETNMTLKQIGDKNNLSKERIRQICSYVRKRTLHPKFKRQMENI